MTSTLTTTYTGTPQQTQFSLVMNGTCVADLNSAKADFVQTCKELLCPGKQYWDMSKNACINAPLNPPGAGAAAAPAPDPLPATIRGCEYVTRMAGPARWYRLFDFRLTDAVHMHTALLQSSSSAGRAANRTKGLLTPTSVREAACQFRHPGEGAI